MPEGHRIPPIPEFDEAFRCCHVLHGGADTGSEYYAGQNFRRQGTASCAQAIGRISLMSVKASSE